MRLPLLVTGCARSGTLYTASLLRRAGVDAGHERAFAVRRQRPLGEMDVEVSWLAAPHESPGALIAHQVRHPLRVIGSLLARGTFRAGSRRARYGAYAARFCPEIGDAADEITRCAAYWISWNRLAGERAIVRWRVETLDAATLAVTLQASGRPIPRHRIERALADVPRDVHATPARAPIGWQDLGETADAVRRLAEEYGYA